MFRRFVAQEAEAQAKDLWRQLEELTVTTKARAAALRQQLDETQAHVRGLRTELTAALAFQQKLVKESGRGIMQQQGQAGQAALSGGAAGGDGGEMHDLLAEVEMKKGVEGSQKLHERVAELEGETELLRGRLVAMEAAAEEAGNVKSQLVVAEAEVESLKGQLEAATAASADAEELQQQLLRQREQAARLHARLEALEGGGTTKIKVAEREAAALRRQLEAAEEEVEELRGRLTAQQTHFEEAAEQQVAQAQQAERDLKRRLEAQEEEIEVLKACLEGQEYEQQVGLEVVMHNSGGRVCGRKSATKQARVCH